MTFEYNAISNSFRYCDLYLSSLFYRSFSGKWLKNPQKKGKLKMVEPNLFLSLSLFEKICFKMVSVYAYRFVLDQFIDTLSEYLDSAVEIARQSGEVSSFSTFSLLRFFILPFDLSSLYRLLFCSFQIIQKGFDKCKHVEHKQLVCILFFLLLSFYSFPLHLFQN